MVWHRVMNANQYGYPQTRGRLYIVGIRCQTGPVDQKRLTEADSLPEWHQAASAFASDMQIAEVALSKFLNMDMSPTLAADLEVPHVAPARQQKT